MPAILLSLATAPILLVLSEPRTGWRQMVLVCTLFGLLGSAWLIRLDPVFGVPAWLVATVLIVLQIPPVGWLLGRLRDRWGVSGMLWWAPVAWAGWEWARSHPPLGSPWFSLGHGLWRLPVLCQVAEVTGVPGLSLCLATVGAGLARWMRSGRKDGRQLLLAGGLLAGLLVYGQIRTRAIDATDGRSLRAACVQPNLPAAAKRIVPGEEMLVDAVALTRETPLGTRLVVWPETAVTSYLDEEPAASMLSEVADAGGFVLAAGGFHRTSGEGWPWPKTNAAVVFEPQRRIAGVYSKIRLVPFGEYMPWRSKKWMRPLARRTPQFFAGREFRPVRTSVGILGIGICYESVFPNDCAALVRAGAEVLVIMTNDDQLSQMGAREHYQQAVFRCIEDRRWMVRCANGGVSAMVDATGRVRAESPWNQRLVLDSEVKMRTGLTPIVRYGDWFGGICLLLACVAACSPRRKEPAEAVPHP